MKKFQEVRLHFFLFMNGRHVACMSNNFFIILKGMGMHTLTKFYSHSIQIYKVFRLTIVWCAKEYLRSRWPVDQKSLGIPEL